MNIQHTTGRFFSLSLHRGNSPGGRYIILPYIVQYYYYYMMMCILKYMVWECDYRGEVGTGFIYSPTCSLYLLLEIRPQVGGTHSQLCLLQGSLRIRSNSGSPVSQCLVNPPARRPHPLRFKIFRNKGLGLIDD